MLDLVAALEWVRENTQRFGGDPDSVMVWGQSGGGAKTSTLLAMPSAQGLFKRAAIQSGSSLRHGRAKSRRNRELLLASSASTESRIAELSSCRSSSSSRRRPRSAAPDRRRLLSGGRRRGAPAPPVRARRPEISRHPDDHRLDPRRPALALDQLRPRRRGIKARRGSARRERATKSSPPTARVTPTLALPGAGAHHTDPSRARRPLQAERKAAQGGAPAYLYLWNWPSPGMGGKFGAVHGVDVGLAFHNSPATITGGGTPEGEPWPTAWPRRGWRSRGPATLTIHRSRSGRPTTRVNKPTMVFDTETRVEKDPKLRPARVLVRPGPVIRPGEAVADLALT